jgi:hypothetical protein
MTTLMRSNPVRVLAALAALVVTATPGRADDAKAGAKDNKLVGTWKLVSAKFRGEDREIKGTTIKYVTPTHFIWLTYGDDGQVSVSMGGPCTIDGDKYEETPEYGVGPIVNAYKGKLQSFTWKVDGNKWHHQGKLSGGFEIEEVWERVEKK